MVIFLSKRETSTGTDENGNTNTESEHMRQHASRLGQKQAKRVDQMLYYWYHNDNIKKCGQTK